jgi:hypothetical protein
MGTVYRVTAEFLAERAKLERILFAMPGGRKLWDLAA